MLCDELLHAPLPNCLQLRIVLHIIAQSFDHERKDAMRQEKRIASQMVHGEVAPFFTYTTKVFFFVFWYSQYLPV